MIESLAFQARARTVDHLGREQIADCPTAVSELWKNSYDAYARTVALNIYDGTPAIATIVDDGHGMSREEFTSRWLVIGTESKADQTETPEHDRSGLPVRTKQGQKGIGRLSSANLGPLLLIVSKRRGSRFVAALIDWRLFENPFLFLLDIQIPVVEFDNKEELLPLLPEMLDRLLSNIWGSGQPSSLDRDGRIEAAWRQFSVQETSLGVADTTQSRIAATVIDTVFGVRHFANWPLWKGEAEQGTILAISDVQFDLEAQLSGSDPDMDSAVRQARDRLIQTLANFTDPFLDEEEQRSGYGATDFATRVTVWEGQLQRNVVDAGHPFDLQALLETEHIVDGQVDENGVFSGRVKAYGTWLSDRVTIRPPGDLPRRKDSLVGSFHLRMGTFEQQLDTTSLSEEAFRKLEAQAEKYGGLSVYRNGLRVLPYGREGSDFFEIEKRRSKHAGREFWSLRRIFGRVALQKERNPNLRDKAGREGLIDNRAAKCFRDLVENVLMTTARHYFGSDSELRKQIVPDRKEEYKRRKIDEARLKQRALNRKQFRSNLEKHATTLETLKVEIEQLAETLPTTDLHEENVIVFLRSATQGLRRKYQELSLGEAPRNLGTLEERYLRFRRDYRRSKELLDSLTDSIDSALGEIRPPSARDLASSELSANAAYLHRRLRVWVQEAKDLLQSELVRVSELQVERNRAYHARMLPLLDDVDHGRLSLRQLTTQLERERDSQDSENAELFEPYISALKSLKESIDLASLARFTQDQADELREEVDRLHALAQLGITVEIIGHEIETLEQTTSAGLQNFPEATKKTEAFSLVRDSLEALVERLRFLSPLKLSGPKTRANLTGALIFDYVQMFFRNEMKQEGIRFDATPQFLSFSIFEQPARIYPVFINLVNNAAYWIKHFNGRERHILLDVVDGKVVVADSGPGVDEEDRRHLFSLFFTRKIRGGRGVGLYLCRVNLAAGGHTIEYADKQHARLPGANFMISFVGAKYG